MEELIQQVLQAALALVATAVGGFVIAWLNKLRQKVGLQADAEQDAKIRAAVQNAILSTEERIRAEAKRRLDPLTHVAEVKMAETVGKVLTAIPGISPSEATRIVNEELPKVRAAIAPATAAFLGQVGQAAATSPQEEPLLQPPTMPPA